jgi:hypothetical protein
VSAFASVLLNARTLQVALEQRVVADHTEQKSVPRSQRSAHELLAPSDLT